MLNPFYLLLPLFIILFGSLPAFGQTSEGGRPESFSYNTLKTVPFISLMGVNKTELIAEDSINDITGGVPFRFAKGFPVNYHPRNSGVWDTLPDDSRIWRLGFSSAGALSLNLIFNQYHLPKGARLFLYNSTRDFVLGAFTDKDNKPSGVLPTVPVPGNAIIVELYIPASLNRTYQLTIGQVSPAYRRFWDGIDLAEDDRFGLSECNQVDINCPEGDNWQQEKRAVSRIFFSGQFLCTGSLINNINFDGNPYLLTSNHCIDNPSAANTAIFVFNYEGSVCNGPDGPVSETVSGSTLKATEADTDFTLLELGSTPPGSYNVYYLGWNRSSIPANSSTCIHHPQGDVKKISQDDHAAINYGNSYIWKDSNNNPISITPPNTHWRVDFDLGTTEAGSSGSALLDENHRVVGQLHGGDGNCGTKKYYGKFSKSWADYPQKLSTFLDATSTGIEFINGHDPTCPDTYEPNDLDNSAARPFPSVLPNSGYSQTISSYISSYPDIDKYEIEMTHAGILTLELKNIPQNYQLELYTSTGSLIETSQATGTNNESITFVNPVGTTSLIAVVKGENHVYDPCNAYQLTLDWKTCSDLVGLNSLPSTALPFFRDASGNHKTLGSGFLLKSRENFLCDGPDVDFWKFEVNPGLYGIIMANINSPPGKNYVLRLYDLDNGGFVQSTIGKRNIFHAIRPGDSRNWAIAVWGLDPSTDFDPDVPYELTTAWFCNCFFNDGGNFTGIGSKNGLPEYGATPENSGLTLSADTTQVDPGQPVTLTVSGGSGHYYWSPTGDTATAVITVSPFQTTAYTVTDSAGGGCSENAEINITVNNCGFVADAGPGQVISPGQSAQLQASVSGSGTSPYTYSWSPSIGLSCTSCQNPIASPIATQTYTLTISDAGGCSAQGQATVTVNTGGPTLPNIVANNISGVNLTNNILSYSYQIDNLGTALASGEYVNYQAMLSRSPFSIVAPEILKTGSAGTMGAGSTYSSSHSPDLSFYYFTRADTYYVASWVEYPSLVTESDETDNRYVNPTPVVISPNLVPDNITITPPNPIKGQNLNILANVANQGSMNQTIGWQGSQPGWGVFFYLSTDQVVDPGDSLLDVNYDVWGIEAGNSRGYAITPVAPFTWPGNQTYYVIAVADPEHKSDELVQFRGDQIVGSFFLQDVCDTAIADIVYPVEDTFCVNSPILFSNEICTGCEYTWIFDDGDTVLYRFNEHGFATPGDHTAKVIVWNPCGTADTGYVSVYIKDGIGLTINEIVHETGPGTRDGGIDIRPQFGTWPFFYTWSHGYTGEDPGGLSEGWYSVVVYDTLDCWDSVSVPVLQHPAPLPNPLYRIVGQHMIADDAGGFPDTLDTSMNFGSSMASIGDVNGDGIGDLAVGAKGSKGTLFILFLNENETVDSFKVIREGVSGFNGVHNELGTAIAPLGDFDGDSIPDLAISGPPNNKVWLLMLNANGTIKSEILLDQSSLTSANGWDFGSGLDTVDFDQDGITDLLIGQRAYVVGTTHRGAAYIVLLNANGTIKNDYLITESTNGFGVLHDHEEFGQSIANLGDIDGDGVKDIAIGATGYKPDGITRKGAVYTLRMNSNGTVKSWERISNTNFPDTIYGGSDFGTNVVGLGDFNEDGIGDLAISARGEGKGVWWIVFLNQSGLVDTVRKFSQINGGFSGDLTNSGYFGYDLAPIGDRDGNGVTDFVVSASNRSIIDPYNLGQFIKRGSGSVWITYWDQEPMTPFVSISPKVFLSGPCDTLNGLMFDTLRSRGYVPTIEPYTGLGYTYIGGGGETTPNNVLDQTGTNAIVDWVILELRSEGDSSITIASRSALLQRDGDIVDVDGSAPVEFADILAGNYFLVIKHRNHLGIMSESPLSLSEIPFPIDFTDPLTLTKGGTNAQKLMGGIHALYTGDSDGNGQVQNTDLVLYWSVTAGMSGYLPADFNCDGEVQNTDDVFFWQPNAGKGAQFAY